MNDTNKIWIDGKTLFHLKCLHGKDAVKRTIDMLIEQFENSIEYPYNIKDSNDNTILTVLQKGDG